MSDDLPSAANSSAEDDETLLAEFQELWDAAEDIWERNENSPAFFRYVSADYLSVFDSLRQLRGEAFTFLEWGSGLGVATIMASRLGFDAYGIEADAQLTEYALALADSYGDQARFAQGSFVPDQYSWSPSNGDEVSRTIIDMPCAYDELDMDLRDFDLVYAYPWPDEHTFYHNIMRQFARKDALLLTYDALEGTQLVTFSE
ncbi:MAG: hypothetical protein AAGG44_17480 [Planctomycetota bacterium]